MTQNDAAKYDFTQQIGYLLRRAYQRLTAIFQQTVPASQLTAAQFVVMLTVRDRGPCEIAPIAQHTAIDSLLARHRRAPEITNCSMPTTGRRCTKDGRESDARRPGAARADGAVRAEITGTYGDLNAGAGSACRPAAQDERDERLVGPNTQFHGK
jgi:hypothetical protein